MLWGTVRSVGMGMEGWEGMRLGRGLRCHLGWLGMGHGREGLGCELGVPGWLGEVSAAYSRIVRVSTTLSGGERMVDTMCRAGLGKAGFDSGSCRPPTSDQPSLVKLVECQLGSPAWQLYCTAGGSLAADLVHSTHAAALMRHKTSTRPCPDPQNTVRSRLNTALSFQTRVTLLSSNA